MTLWAALGIGLLQGWLHCSGMCGPFVLAFGLSTRPDASGRAMSVATALAAHNAGRVLGFALLGVVFGAAGAFVNTAGRLTGIQAVAGIAGGALMLAWAVDQWRTGAGGVGLERWSPLRLPIVRVALSRTAGRRDPLGALWAGALLALHPCGLIFAMLIAAAATASASGGGLLMLLFGLGTVPALAAVGAAGALWRHRLQQPGWGRAAAVLVGCSGLLFALRGLAVNGVLPHVSPWLF